MQTGTVLVNFFKEEHDGGRNRIGASFTTSGRTQCQPEKLFAGLWTAYITGCPGRGQQAQLKCFCQDNMCVSGRHKYN